MNILLIEDNQTDRQLIEKMLVSIDSDSFNLKGVATLSDGISELSKDKYDVLLLDLTLPDSSQEKTLKWMKSINMPIVIITGTDDRNFIINALQWGAQDYLIKPKYNKELLQHCLIYAFERWQANKKTVDELVRKNEQTIQYFKKAVESSSDAIGMSTQEGRHFYQNDAFTKMFGLTVEQADGMSGPPSTVYVDEKVGREVFKTIMEGSAWTGEAEMFDKNKNKLNILLRAYPIKDAAGNIISLIGIHTDITERKKSEEEYRIRFDEALDGVVICEAETGIITDANKAIVKLLKMDKSELIGKPQKILHPPDEHTGKFSRTYEQHLSEREGHVLESQVITKDGEIKQVAIKANLFELRGKKMIQGIFRDITEQKKAEKELNENLQDLENFKAMTIDRENTMIELKKEVNKLCEELGKKAPYDLSFLEQP